VTAGYIIEIESQRFFFWAHSALDFMVVGSKEFIIDFQMSFGLQWAKQYSSI